MLGVYFIIIFNNGTQNTALDENRQQFLGEDGKFDRSIAYKFLLKEDGPGISNIDDYLYLLDYMISYRFHQCDTERSGGSLSRILSAQRTLLKDDLVNALVFLFESVPGIHNIDYDKLYEDWLLYLKDITLKRNDNGMVVTNTIADGSKGIRRLKKEADKKDEIRSKREEKKEGERKKKIF